jgi:hypothetical protein
MKRYRYARTQDLFQKNPNLLARYIREGTPWLEDEDSSSFKQEDIKSFYTSLWGTTRNMCSFFRHWLRPHSPEYRGGIPSDHGP